MLLHKIASSIAVLAIILFSLFFTGCASKMSLEEAKQVSVSLGGTSAFVPPPRRINDILELLNQPGQFDSNILREMKTKADAKPPKQAGSSFYQTRGKAAYELGRYKQAFEDYREALRIHKKKSGSLKTTILRRLAITELFFGHFNRAIELYEQALSLGDDSSVYAELMYAYILRGDVEKARETAKNGELFCSTSPKRRNENFILWCDLETLRMKIHLLEAEAKYAEAETYRRQHIRLFQSVKDERPGSAIQLRLGLSYLLLKQDRFTESELEVREALKEALGLAGKDSLLTATVIRRMADILRAQGRLTEAEPLASLGLHALVSSGLSNDSYNVTLARMMLGSIRAAQNNFIGAMNQFDVALNGIGDNQYLYKKELSDNRSYMLSLLMTGRTEQAFKIITNSYNRAVQRFGKKRYGTAELLALRGMANFRLNNTKAAARDFSEATEVLIAAHMDRADYARIQRFTIILDDYLRLLDSFRGTAAEKELGIDAVGESFRIAEASRGRSVQGALAASSARAAGTNPELNGLIRREQDARQQVEVMEATVQYLMAAPSEEQKSETIKDFQAKINSLNKATLVLQDEIKKRFPKYNDFVNPRATTWSSAQQNLRPGEAMISLYTSDEKTYVWVIPFKGKVSFYSSPLGKKELTRMVAGLRKALDPQPTTLGDIPAFDLNRAYEIYRKLLKPVEAGWKGATDLLVIVQGPLAQLPFSLLPTAPAMPSQEKDELFSVYRKIPWLIRKVSVTMLPTVNSLNALRSLPEGDKNRKSFVGFGDPIFSLHQLAEERNKQETSTTQTLLASRGRHLHIRGVRISEKGSLDNKKIDSSGLGQLDRLPDTVEEIQSIAKALDADPTGDVFLGKEAAEQRIKTMDLADRKVIAFATHALVPGDLDGLEQPALALSSPLVTGDKDDGLLTMGEIMKLKLNADCVVLSACNTGAADGQGSEALSGLGRAFFYAGTKTLLVSMWPVETTAARKLVTETFRMQKEDKALSRARALRKSMLALIQKGTLRDDATGKIAASYAHPFFWAPFVLVGDPGTGVEPQ